jgi:hypothetical protein
MAAPRIVATFTGDPVTAFHEGIPARDLTEAMWENLTPDQQQTVAASKVYDLKPKETKALAEGADQADADAPAEVEDVTPPADPPAVDAVTSTTGSDATATVDGGPLGRAGGKRA